MCYNRSRNAKIKVFSQITMLLYTEKASAYCENKKAIEERGHACKGIEKVSFFHFSVLRFLNNCETNASIHTLDIYFLQNVNFDII